MGCIAAQSGGCPYFLELHVFAHRVHKLERQLPVHRCSNVRVCRLSGRVLQNPPKSSVANSWARTHAQTFTRAYIRTQPSQLDEITSGLVRQSHSPRLSLSLGLCFAFARVCVCVFLGALGRRQAINICVPQQLLLLLLLRADAPCTFFESSVAHTNKTGKQHIQVISETCARSCQPPYLPPPTTTPREPHSHVGPVNLRARSSFG